MQKNKRMFKIIANGIKYYSISLVAKKHGIPVTTIYSRFNTHNENGFYEGEINGVSLFIEELT